MEHESAESDLHSSRGVRGGWVARNKVSFWLIKPNHIRIKEEYWGWQLWEVKIPSIKTTVHPSTVLYCNFTKKLICNRWGMYSSRMSPHTSLYIDKKREFHPKTGNLPTTTNDKWEEYCIPCNYYFTPLPNVNPLNIRVTSLRIINYPCFTFHS